MDSSIVVTINARARGRHGHRRRGERALPAGGLPAGAAVPTIGDPQALAFAREIDRLQRQVAALSARPVDADEAAQTLDQIKKLGNETFETELESFSSSMIQ